jgi:hypothetical protein
MRGDHAGELDAGIDAQLGERVPEVAVDRVRGDKQPNRRLAVREPRSDEANHRQLDVR